MNTCNIEKPIVSVIIPVYNVEKFIGRCIESVMAQEFSNFELLLVDDGSTDDSGNKCDNYSKQDPRIKVIHKNNGGVSSARNTALEVASGEYICFIDGDDYVKKDYLSYFIYLLESTGAEAAYSSNLFYGENDSNTLNDEIKIVTGEEAAINQLCYKTNIGVWNKMFRRTLIENGLRFKENQFIGEGFNFNVSAFQMCQKVTIGKKKVYVYSPDNGVSATRSFSEDKWINGLKSIQDIRDNFIIHSDALLNAWKYAKWRTNMDVYTIMVKHNAVYQHKEMAKETLTVMRKEAFSVFKIDSSLKQRFLAFLFWVFPRLTVRMLIWRES